MGLNRIINTPTFRLIRKEPSFSEGIISLVSFYDNVNKYNTDNTGEEADSKSLYSDWKSVGDDLKKSLDWAKLEYGNTNN